MANTEGYIILWFSLIMLIVVFCLIFWPSKEKKIKEAFFKKMKTNSFGVKIITNAPVTYTHDCPFAFPTEEMRDAFYENFKDLIEQCKELL